MIQMVNVAPDRGPSLTPSEAKTLIVSQPRRLESILMDIAALESESISETSSGGPGNSWSGGASGQSGKKTSTISPRDLAIAHLPSPKSMQQTLQKHIEQEIAVLRSQAGSIAQAQKRGAAYKLNEMYSRIRRLKAFLWELTHASVDLIRRTFIRVFVDRQPTL